MLIPRISLISGSITTFHTQMYSDPTLIIVSSFCIQEYSERFSFSLMMIYFEDYFCIQFQLETWFLLIKQSVSRLSATFLKDKPDK
jgi:aromatic ring-cleaving dioxygenase